MNIYTVPRITVTVTRGGYTSQQARPAIEPGVSWVGQPIGDDLYLIATPDALDELPPGQEFGRRRALSAQQMRSVAEAAGINPNDVAQHWFVRGGD